MEFSSGKNAQVKTFWMPGFDAGGKFRGKYRIPSARLRNYDYGQNGAYFVTICTRNREHLFGNITEGNMRYSAIGKIACQCWDEIPRHFPFVTLGAWVVMPNHVHGIIIFDKPDAVFPDAGGVVETQNFASLHASLPGPQSQNLASVVRGYKIGVTKYARANTTIVDVWQPRFYDRIIRDEDEFRRISQYIMRNPQNWERDIPFPSQSCAPGWLLFGEK